MSSFITRASMAPVFKLTAGATDKQAVSFLQKLATSHLGSYRPRVRNDSDGGDKGISVRLKNSVGEISFLLLLELGGKRPNVAVDWYDFGGLEMPSEYSPAHHVTNSGSLKEVIQSFKPALREAGNLIDKSKDIYETCDALKEFLEAVLDNVVASGGTSKY